MLGHRPADAATSAASDVLRELLDSGGDADLQNEIASQVRGGLGPKEGSWQASKMRSKAGYWGPRLGKLLCYE